MNSKGINRRERAHLARVKAAACSVCDREGPSAAHHIRQGDHYTAISLCWDCHQGPAGWHGTKALWRVRKLDELGALNITLGRLADDR